MGDMGKGFMEQISETEFRAVVNEIYLRITLLGRWTGGGTWGAEFAQDEELMRRLGMTLRRGVAMTLMCCTHCIALHHAPIMCHLRLDS